MRKGWLVFFLLLLAPAFAEPIAPAPVVGQPLPVDARVHLILNGREYTWSGSQLKGVSGQELRADQTILLGILQGLLEKPAPAASGSPEFAPALDFTARKPAPVGPKDLGGPPKQVKVKAGSLFGSR